MLMRAKVDFFEVAEGQRDMDRRLHNWAIWCNGSAGGEGHPMWRLYRTPPARGEVAPCGGVVSVDRMDAVRIAKAVAALPEKHRRALNWCYVKPSAPKRAAQSLAVSLEGLALLVRDARQMLINRSA